MKEKKFYEICEDIRRRIPFQYWSYKIGERREEKIRHSLQELKERGIIRDFLQTDKLSFSDVARGIDFFIIYVGSAKYKVCPISVTGERWAEGDRERHPEIPVVTIDFFDTSDSIKSKIMEAISQNK
ncbi:hypothetical protein KKH14_01155 [Patescibacteria group bacterium]|nr:hypothetical protein [Patescibacteria group bacterium]